MEPQDEDLMLSALLNIGVPTIDPVKGVEFDASTSSTGVQEKYLEVQRKNQVDLDDESHLAALEDKGLMSHMADARTQLLIYEKKMAELPPKETLLKQGLELDRLMTSTMRALNAHQMNLQYTSCELDVLGSKLRIRLPADDVMVVKMTSIDADISRMVDALKAMSRDITIAIGLSSSTITGYKRHCAEYDAIIKSMPDAP